MEQDEVLATLHRVVQENKHFTTWTVSTPHLVALVREVVEQEREEIAQMMVFVGIGYRRRHNPSPHRTQPAGHEFQAVSGKHQHAALAGATDGLQTTGKLTHSLLQLPVTDALLVAVQGGGIGAIGGQMTVQQ